jgi:two-component system sensor histidine kinase KdpD
VTTESYRPDPDAILAAIAKGENDSRSGKLTIFLGMAAGVGKTYAMLTAARDRAKEGVDMVIGTVDTHGRAETEELLTELPAIPRRSLEYKGVTLQEMDIDSIIGRKPSLVLVDELAHTNAPGSRHPKRYHDVLELLDAGIDVYTTLNVQHVESRKESVESIAGITVRETVPDSLLERATHIILIDITPAQLLKRLAEGKVYLGDKAEMAAEHFFKEDRLAALREIALRLTAEKVDNDLQVLMATRESATSWKPTERLMVAVSHSPYSEGLIRAARRLAYGLDAPWLGVHVDTGMQLSNDDRARLARNLALVRELGGEMISTADTDIAKALKRVAHQHGVTQLILGRPTRRLLRDLIHRGTLLDELVRESGSFDIHVLRPEKQPEVRRQTLPKLVFESAPVTYVVVLAIVVGVAIMAGLLLPAIGYKAVGFVMFLSTVLLSLFVSIGPILFAATLSALTWNYFFIPPSMTFHISAPEDVAMFIAYFVVAVITGTLTSGIKRRETMIRLRERRTQTLYQIVQTLAASTDRGIVLRDVPAKLNTIVPGETIIIPVSLNGAIDRSIVVLPDWCSSEKEWAVARWAFEHGSRAGWCTDTLPGADALYIPLQGTSEKVGVLAYFSAAGTRLVQEEEEMLSAVVQQLAITLERQLFQERSQNAARLAESERLHQTILNSVSHEIRTPITAIIAAASALQDGRIAADPANLRQLSHELGANAERLNRVVGNLLDLSRIESGMLRLKLDWHDLADVVATALDSHRAALTDHAVSTSVPDNLPLVRIDIQLFEQALSNLLLNAAIHTPKGSKIELTVGASRDSLSIEVSDSGRGLSATDLLRLFDKFYRAPNAPAGGIGIGLTITKGIIEAHGGTLTAENRPGGGAIFRIRLPMPKQPELPKELQPQ